jgi:hypothetical protein
MRVQYEDTSERANALSESLAQARASLQGQAAELAHAQDTNQRLLKQVTELAEKATSGGDVAVPELALPDNATVELAALKISAAEAQAAVCFVTFVIVYIVFRRVTAAT